MDENQVVKVFDKYEITLIIPESDKIGPIEKLIADTGSKIIKTTDLGTKQFAYPIRKLNVGQYFVIQFETEPNLINKINNELKHENAIIRFLTVKALRFPALRPPRKEKADEPKSQGEKPATQEIESKEIKIKEKGIVVEPKVEEIEVTAKEQTPQKVKIEKKTKKTEVKTKKASKPVKISASELDKKLEALVED